MVEIRVAVAGAACAQWAATAADGTIRPVVRLVRRDEQRVRVHSEWESRSVVQVIATVESWLAADGIDSAKLSVGDRSYTMLGPASLGSPSGRAA